MNRLFYIIGDLEKATVSQGIIAVLVLVLLIIMVVQMRRKRPYDGSPREYRREIDAATANGASVQRNMEDLLVELEEMSRKIGDQVDSRFARLEQSISDADKRISALRILIDAARKAEDSGRGSEPADRAGTGEMQGAVGSTSGIPTGGGAREPTLQDEEESGVQERYRAVYDLADQGLSPLEIARQVGQRVGEIELILNLRAR